MQDENGKYYPNPEHLAILEQGVEAWNKWREENPDIVPDLQGVQLKAKHLQNIVLTRANMKAAYLYATHLEDSWLIETNLEEAELSFAHLEESDLHAASLKGAKLIGAHLNRAILTEAHLEYTYSNDAHFEFANLSEAELYGAKLNEVLFEKAILIGTSFRRSSLLGACFHCAELCEANFKGASLVRADLRAANISAIQYDRWTKYRGIRLEGCYGSSLFTRFAQDQDFIEEFRSVWWREPIYWLWLITCDCGRSISPWIAWCVTFVCLFAWKFVSMPVNSFTLVNANTLPWDYWTALYYSVVTFTTLGFGDITPATMDAAWWVMAEVILGYIMLGGLISIFSTKIARRS